jgi:hypothetical protein
VSGIEAAAQLSAALAETADLQQRLVTTAAKTEELSTRVQEQESQLAAQLPSNDTDDPQTSIASAQWPDVSLEAYSGAYRHVHTIMVLGHECLYLAAVNTVAYQTLKHLTASQVHKELAAIGLHKSMYKQIFSGKMGQTNHGGDLGSDLVNLQVQRA